MSCSSPELIVPFPPWLNLRLPGTFAPQAAEAIRGVLRAA